LINTRREHRVRFDDTASWMTPQFQPLTVAALAAFVVTTCYAIGANRFLFGDGAQFVVGLLASESFQDGGRPARILADIMTQAPLLLAIKSGITNVSLLETVYGTTLFAPYLLCIAVWWWASAGQRHYLVFLVAFLYCSAANSSFFAISESHFAAAVFFAQVPLLVLARLEKATLATLWVLGGISIASYETMFVYAPLLLVLAGLRLMAESAQAGRVRIVLALLMVWYLIVFLYCLKEIVFPNSVNYTSSGFREDLTNHFVHQVLGVFRGSTDIHFGSLVSFGAGALLMLTWLLPGRYASLGSKLVLMFGICALAVLIFLLVFPAHIGAKFHYQARVVQAVVPPFLVVLLYAFHRGWIGFPAGWMRQVAAVLCVVVGFQLSWQVYSTWQWSGYMRLFREVVTERPGPIYLDESRLGVWRQGRQAVGTFLWGFTLPAMSVLTSPGGKVSGIVMERGETWPVDPDDPTTLPDLSRYGIDYSRYLAASSGATPEGGPP
jgi:hypothetical protein